VNARRAMTKRTDFPSRLRRHGTTQARRLLSMALAALVLAVMTLLGGALPASASDGVMLSLDGTTWSPTLAGALFASPARVVPGDVVTAHLWARNGSAVTARLSLRAADGIGSGSEDLAGNVTLRVDGDPVAGGTTWRGPLLAPGQGVRLQLEVEFDSGATVGQLGVASVVDTVLLTQEATAGAAAPAQPAPAQQAPAQHAPAQPAGGLASTGADVRNLAAFALGAVALGVLLVRRRRRNSAGHVDGVPAA